MSEHMLIPKQALRIAIRRLDAEAAKVRSNIDLRDTYVSLKGLSGFFQDMEDKHTKQVLEDSYDRGSRTNYPREKGEETPC